MNEEFEKQYIGQLLLERGFKDWARYIFRVLEQKPFEVEAIHQDLFKCFEDIETGKETRLNINIPPRSGKTTLATYFVCYTLIKNPKSNIIYTSYSQSLLADIADKCRQILEHPICKALYPNEETKTEVEEINPIDDFWRDYLNKQSDNNKNTYTSKKIKTSKGGICLFSAIGGQITGYGCSSRNAKKFSGFLLIDDGNKPADIHSATMRNKVASYFKETLLSRLNDSKAPIINIQQRLHLEDLSGFLSEKYNFNTVKKPLIENGICLLPHQYDESRIKELQIDNYLFSSQYQQEPIIKGGEIIKREWFKYYDVNYDYDYTKIVIASDTAMSVKESADRSCLMVGAVTRNNELHVLDLNVGRWDYPTLKQNIVNIWNKWQREKHLVSASGLYVEEKASGIQILQELTKIGIPLMPLKADKDKLARVQGVLEYIASGMVYLPHSENYGLSPQLLNEVESFTRDDSHAHDDITDTLVYLINATIAKRRVSILEVL